MMEIKIQDRQTGKTYDIIKLMKQDKKAVMIVVNAEFKNDLIRKYDFGKRVFTIREVVHEEVLWGKKYSEAYIDEVGCCLDLLIPRIKYGTHTNEE